MYPTSPLFTKKGEDPKDIFGKPYSKSVLSNYPDLTKRNITLPQDSDFSLKTPSLRRLENQKLKTELEKVKEMREQIQFLGKRERILKNAFKDGVQGFDLPKSKLVMVSWCFIFPI